MLGMLFVLRYFWNRKKLAIAARLWVSLAGSEGCELIGGGVGCGSMK